MEGLFSVSVAPKMSKVNKLGEVPLFLRITLYKQRVEVSLKTCIPK